MTASASEVGEGVLISDTEKRPFTVGVLIPESDRVLIGVTPVRETLFKEAGFDFLSDDLSLAVGVVLEVC